MQYFQSLSFGIFLWWKSRCFNYIDWAAKFPLHYGHKKASGKSGDVFVYILLMSSSFSSLHCFAHNYNSFRAFFGSDGHQYAWSPCGRQLNYSHDCSRDDKAAVSHVYMHCCAHADTESYKHTPIAGTVTNTHFVIWVRRLWHTHAHQEQAETKIMRPLQLDEKLVLFYTNIVCYCRSFLLQNFSKLHITSNLAISDAR